MIIAILIWLQCMSGSTQYTQADYDRMVIENRGTIDAIMADPLQQQIITHETSIIAPTVIIIEGQ